MSRFVRKWARGVMTTWFRKLTNGHCRLFGFFARNDCHVNWYRAILPTGILNVIWREMIRSFQFLHFGSRFLSWCGRAFYTRSSQRQPRCPFQRSLPHTPVEKRVEITNQTQKSSKPVQTGQNWNHDWCVFRRDCLRVSVHPVLKNSAGSGSRLKKRNAELLKFLFLGQKKTRGLWEHTSNSSMELTLLGRPEQSL